MRIARQLIPINEVETSLLKCRPVTAVHVNAGKHIATNLGYAMNCNLKGMSSLN